jgi:hypothetical protein
LLGGRSGRGNDHKKKTFIFIIIYCCLLTVPVFLPVPAGALDAGSVAITGIIPLVTYNISVTGIDWYNATVTWKTNDNANSTVEYGTTTSYGSLITDVVMAKDHTISLNNLSPGTVYHYLVISVDLAGNRAASSDSTFTTTAIPPVTIVPTVAPTSYYWGGGGGGGGGGTSPGRGSPQQANPLGEFLGPPEQLLTGLQGSLLSANNPGIGAPAASGNYPMGVLGLIYNADGQGTLIIDMSAAQAAGATVTIHFDHVEVYQHHSPGVLLTFWGNNLQINNGTITGLVSRAEFVTDPLNATLVFGNVSGSVHAALPVLVQQANIDLTIPGNLSTDIQNQFQDILSRNGLRLDTVAYTLNVHKVNLTTGPANVTFTLPASWVDEHGGKDAVRIIRISEETGKQELIDSVYEGVDAQENMIFRGDSPYGTSLFGLVTTGTTAAGQNTYPIAGMFVWLIGVILIGVIALLAVIAYFGWWKRLL